MSNPFDAYSSTNGESGEQSPAARDADRPGSTPAGGEPWLDRLAAPADPEETREDPAPAGGGSSRRTSGGRSSAPLAIGLGLAVVAILGILAAIAWALAGVADDASGETALTLPPTPSSSSALPVSSAAPAAVSSAAVSSPASAVAAAPTSRPSECVASTVGKTVTGNGAGDLRSVAGAILAFDHGYYVDRDAKKALAATSPTGRFKKADALQAGIDRVPAGTTHCLKITPSSDLVATVELTEHRPGQDPEVTTQTVTAAREGGQVRIVSIEEKK